MKYQDELVFNTFDEFNSFPHGWDTEFSTTSQGEYSVLVKRSVAPRIMVNTAWLSSPTLQRASTPAGMRTFALPLHLPNSYLWRGLPVDHRSLMTFPSDRELFSTMREDSEVLTMALDQSFVDECLKGWGADPDSVFAIAQVSELSDSQYHRMKRNLELMTEFIAKYGNDEQFESLSNGIREYLIEHMLEAVTTSMLDYPKVTETAASKRVRQAADYILENLGNPLSVSNLCKSIGCSRRTLEQSFRKYTGTTPKQFIQTARLSHCRAALRSAPPDTLVKRVAYQHGFWHMGQFAIDYKRHFGELPSETLQQ